MKVCTRPGRDVVPETFEDLHALRPLRPITDKVDLENAQEIADRLAVLGKRTRDQDDDLSFGRAASRY